MIGILLNTEGDLAIDTTLDATLKIKGLVIGNCTADIVERVLVAYPGAFKNVPLIGANITADLNGPSGAISRAKILEHLKSAGVVVNNVSVQGTEINISYDN